MDSEARWATPTLTAYQNGKFKSPKDTKDFLLFRFNAWMLEPALFLFNSQPQVPGHLTGLALLAWAVYLAAKFAGLTVGDVVALYGSWPDREQKVSNRLYSLQRSLASSIQTLVAEGKLWGEDEFCSEPSMGGRNWIDGGPLLSPFQHGNGKVIYHTGRLAEELAQMARACVADIPFSRLKIVHAYLMGDRGRLCDDDEE